MNPQSLPLSVVQGSDFELNFQIRTKGGAYWNITDWTARMQVRPFATSTTKILDATTDNYIDLSENGSVSVAVPASVTSGFTAGSHVYDLEIISPSGVVYKPLQGAFRVSNEVTR
jgi:hypothetical protein